MAHILWIALPVYVMANAYLLLLGVFSGVLLLLANTVYLVLLAWLTKRFTHPLPVEFPEMDLNKSMLWEQVGVILAILLLIGLRGSQIPVWSSIVNWFYNWGEATLSAAWFGGPGNSIANPMQYFIMPFGLLLLLGARPKELGLGQGHKVWQVCLVWLALPLVIWIGLLATGSLAPQTFARRLISNSFQNGFFEEFLLRGALFTCLRRLLSLPWALAVQAVLFGLWHLHANTQSMDGDTLAGLALCVVSQTVCGFVYDTVFQRTRNLVTPSVAQCGDEYAGSVVWLGN